MKEPAPENNSTSTRTVAPKLPATGKDRNQHVMDYLQHYLAFSTPPKFAVLLNGPWGVGKTYVINRFLGSLDAEKTKYIYVSLYGISSLGEIDDAILQSMYPVLKHKGVDIGSRALKAAGKYFNVELDLKAKDFISASKSELYIFDDLERCEMPINTAMGYINVFVEHEGRKVVVIANETEISDARYKRVREKVIGKTFDIQSALDSALDEFIGSVKDEGSRSALQNNLATISHIYDQSELHNLRILQQTIWDFDRTFQALEERHQTHDAAISALVGQLFALSFEVKAGRLSSENILARESDLMLAYVRREEGEPLPKMLEVEKRYPAAQIDASILSDETLVNLIIKGIVDQERIRRELDQSSYFVVVDEEPAWRTIWYSLERKDEDVERAALEMERKFAAHEYTNSGEILHVLGNRLWLADIGFIPINRQQVVSEAKAYIEKLYSDGLLEPFDQRQEFFDRSNDSHDGLVFQEWRSPEFGELRAYMLERRRAAEVDRWPLIAEELLQNMKDDPSAFLRQICLTNEAGNRYLDVPVLASIEPTRFVEVFLALDPIGQRSVMRALKSRYEHDKLKGELRDELTWLTEIRDRILAAAGTMSLIAKDRLEKLVAHGIGKLL